MQPSPEQHSSEQLARLWTESQPVVASYIFSLVPDFHQAEDILQQVAVILVREFHKFDATRPFLPWAMGIAKNTALKSRREVARDCTYLLEDSLIERVQAAFAEKSERWMAVRHALKNCLSHQQQRTREVLQWRYSHDLKPQEVARRMGITPGAVRVMLHRARGALRECIQRKLEASQ
jgi:RNA polymerase sigma-70 factor (ECF subfamily)